MVFLNTRVEEKKLKNSRCFFVYYRVYQHNRTVSGKWQKRQLDAGNTTWRIFNETSVFHYVILLSLIWIPNRIYSFKLKFPANIMKFSILRGLMMMKYTWWITVFLVLFIAKRMVLNQYKFTCCKYFWLCSWRNACLPSLSL